MLDVAFVASRVGLSLGAAARILVLAVALPDLKTLATVGQAFAGILTGLIAVLGVPLALRQVVNLQRELRIYEQQTRRRLDAESNLNISADYSITRAAHDTSPHTSHPGGNGHPIPLLASASGKMSTTGQPSPAPEPGKRVLRLDLTLENVGEGSVDMLACLVAARELVYQGYDVVERGRDVQWDDLTTHYWDGDENCISPGLSTTKHIVFAQDALARIKAHSRKTLARIDQVRERDADQDIYLLYRAFVAARSSSRAVEDVQAWATLQRALLNVNAPAFREAAAEQDPLGLVASADGWRLFLHHHQRLADPKLPQLRIAATREESLITDPVEYEKVHTRLDAELQAYCTKVLLPSWRQFRADYDRMTREPLGFAALLGDRSFRRHQRAIEHRFPWDSQEVWTEYFYVTLPVG
ncbi:MAG: hypothetical protein ACXVCO_12820 [Ktedonobacterales bacterium]